MMMMEKEELLGLSLSLTSTTTTTTSISPHQHLMTLMPSSSSSSSSPPLLHSFPFSCSHKPLSCDLPCHPADRKRPMTDACRGAGDAGPLLGGIDVNRAPFATATAAERDEEEDLAGAYASSPNSTVSSAAGGNKSAEGDSSGKFTSAGAGEEFDAERASSRGPASDEEDGEGARKKLRLSKDQSAILEESFKEHSTLNPKQKLALAKQLNLRPRQVEVWFQNRRARTKLKQTEVDCEFLKRCCESLTEENRRLQKEVQELRALKLSPQLYMHMTPPTTLTMCPSCERVSNSGTITGAISKSSSSAAPEHRQFLLHHRPATAPWAPPMALHPQRS